WDIPTDMYSKINQKMVVLKRSKKIIPVEAFMRYIRSAEARAIIRANGYDVL
ncbi:MAG: substrate-binding domain-containing protein, partial [Gammaproteobacteria bacterium]|nr:substrate-binding domain-containing protein [Gammaproteobacteria bacterium]